MEPSINIKFRDLLWPLAAEERNQLEQNILEHGCRDPLVVWRGTLIDGHNRYAICTKHSLPFQTVEIDLPDEDAVEDWIDANQLGRRNGTPDQMKLALGRRYNRMKKKQGGDRKSAEIKSSGQIDHLKTEEVLAKEHGVSPKTVRRAAEFATQVEQSAVLQEAIANRVPVKKAKKEERAKERAERKTAVPLDLPPNAFALHLSPVAELATAVEPESVDYIITDPPYAAEYLPTYSDLGAFAAHALKPGGSLICMIGQSYMPEIIARLSEHLTYHWTAAYLTPGGQAVQLWDRKVNTFWKPLLWFIKGKYEGDWVGDVSKSKPNDNDKSHHEWGQSESGIADVIERFTYPGQVICDPFVGGGTTALVAVQLNRQFIGGDIDQRAIATTAKRLLGDQS